MRNITLDALIREITAADHNAVEWLSLHRTYMDMKDTLTPEDDRRMEESGALDVLITMYVDVTARGIAAFNAAPRRTAAALEDALFMRGIPDMMKELQSRLDSMLGNMK